MTQLAPSQCLHCIVRSLSVCSLADGPRLRDRRDCNCICVASAGVNLNWNPVPCLSGDEDGQHGALSCLHTNCIGRLPWESLGVGLAHPREARLRERLDEISA